MKIKYSIVFFILIIIIVSGVRACQIPDDDNVSDNSATPTHTSTQFIADVASSPSATPAAIIISNLIQTPTPIPTNTSIPTVTNTPIPTVTNMPIPIASTPLGKPTMPYLNKCSTDYQNITAPLDGQVFAYGREWLTIEGTANWSTFEKYQIDLYTPSGAFHDFDTKTMPVVDGELLQWNFENITAAYGEGWYIIRLLVIQNDDNHIAIGEHDGCHIRVYLPAPS